MTSAASISSARPHGQQPWVARARRRRGRRSCAPAPGSSSTAPARAAPRRQRRRAVAASSSSHAEPSGRPTKPRTRPPPANTPTGVWHVASSTRTACALGVQRTRGCARGPPAPPRRGRARARLQRQRALAGRGDEDAAASAARPPRRDGQPVAGPAAASTSASTSPAARLRSRVSTLPRSSHDLEVRPRGQQLRAAAQRARPDPRALAHRASAARPRARRAARPAAASATIAGAPAQLARHVLGRVHREVDLAGQQRGLERADPARLVAARAVDVAGRA